MLTQHIIFTFFTPFDEEDFKKLNSVTFSCVNNILIWSINLDY